MNRIQKITEKSSALVVSWESGENSVYPYLYLRDNCPSPATRHSTGQKLIETSAIAPDIAPLKVILSAHQEVVVDWNCGTHTSNFSADWLFGHRISRLAIQERQEEKKKKYPVSLWNAELNKSLPEGNYPDVLTNEAALADWLEKVSTYGFAILRNVPAEPEMVIQVTSLFGYIRETNYGKLFDVKTTVNPNNLAFTSLGLSAHTDNPYRNPTPTLQLLHCLSSSAAGGNSILVDGFKVIADLKAYSSELFELLCTTPVTFSFADQHSHIERTTTIIGRDVYGEVNAIRFNNRSIQSFEVEEDKMPAFYAAYQQLAKMIDDEKYFVQFKMEATDLFIVDNERILHGRTAYDSAAGERFLQGAYADRDGLLSKMNVLNYRRYTNENSNTR